MNNFFYSTIIFLFSLSIFAAECRMEKPRDIFVFSSYERQIGHVYTKYGLKKEAQTVSLGKCRKFEGQLVMIRPAISSTHISPETSNIIFMDLMI